MRSWLPRTASRSLSFYFKVIKLYLVPFLQISKARGERKTRIHQCSCFFPGSRVRSQDAFAKHSLVFLLQKPGKPPCLSTTWSFCSAFKSNQSHSFSSSAFFSLVGSLGIG